MEIQRYTTCCPGSMCKKSDGPYVLYADHLAALEAAVKEKENGLDFFKGFYCLGFVSH